MVKFSKNRNTLKDELVASFQLYIYSDGQNGW